MLVFFEQPPAQPPSMLQYEVLMLLQYVPLRGVQPITPYESELNALPVNAAAIAAKVTFAARPRKERRSSVRRATTSPSPRTISLTATRPP